MKKEDLEEYGNNLDRSQFTSFSPDVFQFRPPHTSPFPFSSFTILCALYILFATVWSYIINKCPNQPNCLSSFSIVKYPTFQTISYNGYNYFINVVLMFCGIFLTERNNLYNSKHFYQQILFLRLATLILYSGFITVPTFLSSSCLAPVYLFFPIISFL